MSLPKDVYILTPGISEYVTFHGKRDLAQVTELSPLRLEDYSGSSRWNRCHHNGPYEGGEKMEIRKRSHDARSRGGKDTPKVDGGATGEERGASGSWQGQEAEPSQSLQKEHGSAKTSISAHATHTGLLASRIAR